jgi:DNA-binding transcriptional regulator PaaX
MKKLSPITQKVLLIFFGGLTLGLSPSPKQFFKTAKALAYDWQVIKREELNLAIRSLYKSRLIEEQQEKDGKITLIISEAGKKKALSYQIEDMVIKKPKIWDGKWRFVIFDIPETKKKYRDALRMKLKELGFYEFQKSVFAHPFDCEDEINFLIEFLGIRPYVRLAIVENVDNDLHLRKIFKLL